MSKVRRIAVGWGVLLASLGLWGCATEAAPPIDGESLATTEQAVDLSLCGDGFCDESVGEDSWNCATDCGFCGDGICGSGEDPWSCSSDCGSPSWCGNGTCEAGEDSWTCPMDCGSPGWCGNGTCDMGEDVWSCNNDCGYCGDGMCGNGEDPWSCSADCGSPTWCGDGWCGPGEDTWSCNTDCGFCGDSLCGNGEDNGNCSSDCGPSEWCGDGSCGSSEDCNNCSTDCGTCAWCGDGSCNNGEDCGNCALDCGSCEWCGNGSCGSGEDCSNCQADCGSCEWCGNGSCGSGEDCSTCQADCGMCGFCGDGSCNNGEDCGSCNTDCGSCGPVCGDAICEGGEDCSNCDLDCGSCGPICGDGNCDGGEDCSSCDLDCGSCVSCDPPACSAQASLSRRSLVISKNTDSEIPNAYATAMARFPLRAVLNQLIEIQGASTTADEYFQRLWLTMSDTDTTAGVQHCTDPINGFTIDCPRNEKDFATQASPEDFVPVGLFNRFDLAQLDGSSCGEFRIVYANAGMLNINQRTFIIFEGAVPPPAGTPEDCFEACRPIADFWSGLSNITDATALADALESFYFSGLPNFRPVVHPRNYGLDAPTVGTGYNGAPFLVFGEPSGGQIRTNSIAPPQQWVLREFHVDRQCSDETIPSTCEMFFKPVTVKANPAGLFFSGASTHADAPSFRADFIAIAPTLASATNINDISLPLPGKYDHGESTAHTNRSLSESSYPTFFNQSNGWLATPSGGFPNGLTPNQVVARAQTQACAGCHRFSRTDNLGAGLVWPSQNTKNGQPDFTHIDETGQISSALDTQFLPHRQDVMEAFLSNCAASSGLLAQSAQAGEVASSLSAGAAQTHIRGGDGRIHPAEYVVQGRKTLGGSTTH